MIINYMKVITDENTKNKANTICFLDPVPSAERKIRKARAEEFIHIFVHQKAKLIEFLEHMVQVTFLSLSSSCSVSCFFSYWKAPEGERQKIPRRVNSENVPGTWLTKLNNIRDEDAAAGAVWWAASVRWKSQAHL